MGNQKELGVKQFRIGLYGRRSSGKSALIKALTGKPSALVRALHHRDVEQIYKNLSLENMGEITFGENPGAENTWNQGNFSTESLDSSVRDTDLAIILFREADMHGELIWFNYFRKAGMPVIPVISRMDTLGDGGKVLSRIVEQKTGYKPLCLSVMTGEGLEELRAEIVKRFSEVFGGYAMKEDLLGEGERVLLVVPQEVRGGGDKALLPHFKVFCELLKRKCLVLSCIPDMLPDILDHLKEPPKLIIADIEHLDKVREVKPAGSMLTSYLVLRDDCMGEVEGKG